MAGEVLRGEGDRVVSRRPSKALHIGDVQVGGDAPVRVQSMCSTDTADGAAPPAPPPPLPPLADGEMPPPIHQRMVEAALWEIGLLEEMGFDLIKVSMKAFDVPPMVAAYRDIAPKIPYPLHLGVT